MQSGASGESYNIGANQEMRNIDVVNKICHILDSKFAKDKDLVEKFPFGF